MSKKQVASENAVEMAGEFITGSGAFVKNAIGIAKRLKGMDSAEAKKDFDSCFALVADANGWTEKNRDNRSGEYKNVSLELREVAKKLCKTVTSQPGVLFDSSVNNATSQAVIKYVAGKMKSKAFTINAVEGFAIEKVEKAKAAAALPKKEAAHNTVAQYNAAIKTLRAVRKSGLKYGDAFEVPLYKLDAAEKKWLGEIINDLAKFA